MLTTSALAGHLTHGLLAASRLSPARKPISAEAPATPSAFKSKAALTAQLATAERAKPLVHTIAKNTVVPSGPKTLQILAQPAVTDKVVTPNVLTTADQQLQEPQDPWQARLDALLATGVRPTLPMISTATEPLIRTTWRSISAATSRSKMHRLKSPLAQPGRPRRWPQG